MTTRIVFLQQLLFFVDGLHFADGLHHKHELLGMRAWSIAASGENARIGGENARIAKEAIETKLDKRHAVDTSEESSVNLKGVLLYCLISVDSNGALTILLKKGHHLPTHVLSSEEAFFMDPDPRKLKVYDPKKVASSAVAQDLGFRLWLNSTYEKVETTLEAGIKEKGYANYVEAAQELYDKEVQYVAPVPTDSGETILFGEPFALFDTELRSGTQVKSHGQLVFVFVAKEKLPPDLQRSEMSTFGLGFDLERNKNELKEFEWQPFDLQGELDKLLLQYGIRRSSIAERHALWSAICRVQPDGNLSAKCDAGKQLFTWNPEAICGESKAEDRSKLLQSERGATEEAAQTQVMIEFPLKFLRWNPDANCASSTAADIVKEWRNTYTDSRETEAREKVINDFPASFGLKWVPDLECDGSLSENRSLWLQEHRHIPAEAAQAIVIREFAPKFAAYHSGLPSPFRHQKGTEHLFEWRPEALCNGDKAEDRCQWVRKHLKRTLSDAQMKVMMEYPLKFLKWNPNADCDGKSAEDRSLLRIMANGGSEAEAQELVMSEYPMSFGIEWDPDVSCDGSRAEDRSLWLQAEKHMKVEEARAQVIREFAAEFVAPKHRIS